MQPCLLSNFWRGGRWVEGTGLTSGEEVELVNSYISKLALVTKRMLPEGMWYT